MLRDVTFNNTDCSYRYFLGAILCTMGYNKEMTHKFRVHFLMWFKLEDPFGIKERKRESPLMQSRAPECCVCKYFVQQGSCGVERAVTC